MNFPEMTIDVSAFKEESEETMDGMKVVIWKNEIEHIELSICQLKCVLDLGEDLISFISLAEAISLEPRKTIEDA